MKKIFTLALFVLCFSNLVLGQQNSGSSKNSWTISNPIFKSGTKGTFDETAVKDPSIVYFNNAWHLFYTARGNNEYTTAYTTAKNIDKLNTSQRVELKPVRGKTRYGCAPQVFYFDPHQKWYLIFQNRDTNYQAAFCTNSEITDPSGWTDYQNLIEKNSNKKWIDFWVIANDEKVYLFYTESHNGVMVCSTSIHNFPHNWSKSKKVFSNVHEAVHVYKVVNQNEYHMIYELNTKGVRSFGLATANHLEGPWKNLSTEYATGEQLLFPENSEEWTEMVSHGEAIRSGYNQLLEYNPKNCKWIIQGIEKKEIDRPYPSLPWQLGIIEMAK